MSGDTSTPAGPGESGPGASGPGESGAGSSGPGVPDPGKSGAGESGPGVSGDVPTPSRPAVTDAVEQVTAVVRVEGFPTAHMPVLFDGVFTRLFPALGQAGAQPVGAAFALYTGIPGETADLEVGIPVDRVLEGAVDLGGIEVPDGTSFALVAQSSALPGGRTATAAHLGGYDRLGDAWQTFLGTLEAQGVTVAMPFWEVYTTEPHPDMDPADLRTDLFISLAD